MGWDEELERMKDRRLRELLDRSKKPKAEVQADEYADAPVTLTDGNFLEFTRSFPLVVVDCWAPWCYPCRLLSPTIEALAKDYKGRVAFGKLNTEENFEVPSRFGISSIPTLLFFKQGKLVDTLIGVLPRRAIEAQILKHLAASP